MMATVLDGADAHIAALMVVARRHRPALLAAAWAVALVGYAGFAGTLWMIAVRDGGVAFDARAYWLAGQHAVNGEPLYSAIGIGDAGAYRYTPTFAWLMVPFGALPELVFTWGYRAVALLCLRYLVGSWRWVGWALLLSPVTIELVALNITLPIAALHRWALRDGRVGGRIGAGALPFAASLKYGSVLLLPYLWLRRPGLRRSMLLGAGVLVAVTAAHAAIEPEGGAPSAPGCSSSRARSTMRPSWASSCWSWSHRPWATSCCGWASVRS